MKESYDVASEPIASKRFLFIDGLRGIAAVAVVISHAYQGPYSNVVSASLPTGWDAPFMQGLNGVAIFFVISGFVIPYSLRDVPPTVNGLLNFCVRRQLRLDPPYWSALALVLLDYLIGGLKTGRYDTIPTIPHTFAHIIYAQELLGIFNILRVSWTLCIEAQFYMSFVFVMIYCRRSQRFKIASLLMAGVVATSLFGSSPFNGWPHASVVVPYYPWFTLGIWVWWVWDKRIPPRWLFLLIGALGVAAIIKHDYALVTGCCTATILHLAIAWGGMYTWLAGNLIQFFGRISYSLYLVHEVILLRVMNFFFKRAPDNVWFAWTSLTLGVGVSIGLAAAVHHLIERPSIRLARSFKNRIA